MARYPRIHRPGPRVVAALLRELDDREIQVTAVIDALANSGDALMAANRELKDARAQREIDAEIIGKLSTEADRLRQRLLALHPGVTP